MRLHVLKWGNSLAVRLPKALAVAAHLEEGAAVEVSLTEGKIVLKPVTPDELSLDDLLAKVTPDNLHEEVGTGPRTGNEAW